MQCFRGWVRTVCVTKPFGIHFKICFCRPIPSNVNLQKFACPSRSKVTEIITKNVSCDGVEVGCERDVFHHYQAGKIAARLQR
jgi:hypothetical protein